MRTDDSIETENLRWNGEVNKKAFRYKHYSLEVDYKEGQIGYNLHDRQCN